MNNFEITPQWLSAGGDDPEFQQTMCMLGLRVGNVTLTQNEDFFSKTVRDAVLVSAYPFAQWIAQSWWRLLHEPLPARGTRPSVDWRLAHEVGASNHGFVWPQIMFASDKTSMQVWAAPLKHPPGQSVRYLNGLITPAYIPLQEFAATASNFVESVIARLHAVGIHDSALSGLWNEVLDERADPEMTKIRRIEAELGYEPDECPDSQLRLAISLEAAMGEKTLAELVSVYGKLGNVDSIEQLAAMVDRPGIIGTPQLPATSYLDADCSEPPWMRAVSDARAIRSQLVQGSDKIENSSLLNLLGVDDSFLASATDGPRQQVALAVPQNGHGIKYVSRKRHPIAKRFEMARFVGDLMYSQQHGVSWLAQTDLATSRQKYQRAFAAELLCPIRNLTEFLDDDFSDGNLEDAAHHFDISEDTVKSLLTNNGLLYSRDYDTARLPYHLSY